MNSSQKFNSLNDKSAWAYTKQKANFDDLYKSTKLFYEIPNVTTVNVEDYFSTNFAKYGISSNRHRILAICQMFGLITKSAYYSRGGTYSDEVVTPAFVELVKHAINSKEYNIIRSEQLLKIKVKAIIDTTNCRDDYFIYPFIFLFLVMWKLDKEYGVKKVSLNKLWSYVLTCKSMNEVDDAVNWMMDPNAVVSPYVSQYKSDSRILTLFFDNTKMFSQEGGLLSLNHPIADVFYDDFILKQDLAILSSYLLNDAQYETYLNNIQNFNIDLTDNPTGIVKHTRRKTVFKKSGSGSSITSQKDITVVIPEKSNDDIKDIIDSILEISDEQAVKEASVYESNDEILASNNRTPTLREGLESNKRYTTDPRLAKTAIKNAGYICELSSSIPGSHHTFKSMNGTNYLEAHHLVPMKAQKDFIYLGVNLDRLENIVALCPTCHKAVHYGNLSEKVKYLKPLYDLRIAKLKSVGIDIDFDVLINDYYK